MADYEDDSGIGSGEVIWRRIPEDQIHWDVRMGRYRPQSGMFSDSGDNTPMSASRAECHASARDYLDAAGYPDHLLVALDAAYVRDLGCSITRSPTCDDPGHVLVSGPKPASVQKKLARAAEWVVPPDRSPPG